jgi:hypothetical protein
MRATMRYPPSRLPRFFTWAVFLAGLAAAPLAHAQRAHVLVGMGMDFGGETLLEVTYTDGSRDELNAGTGVAFALGGVFSPAPFGDHGVEFQLQAGVKGWNITEAENGSATIVRWPLEALLLYKYMPSSIRLGAGVVCHLGTTLSTTGVLGDADIGFSPALGWVVQLDWAPATSRFGMILGLRYVGVSYAVSGGGLHIDASNIGLTLALTFGDADSSQAPASADDTPGWE